MALTEPIRGTQQVRAFMDYYLKRNELRNHVLVVMGINTGLRIYDLLQLTWDDVYDFSNGRFRPIVPVTEQKTGKPKSITLNKLIIKALTSYMASTPPAMRGHFLFCSRKGGNRPISRQQAYRIIRDCAEALCFNTRVSCHSLRKTFGYLAWKSGVSPVIIMNIFNHTSLAVTQRYLGVTQDDIDDCYHKLAEIT